MLGELVTIRLLDNNLQSKYKPGQLLALSRDFSLLKDDVIILYKMNDNIRLGIVINILHDVLYITDDYGRLDCINLNDVLGISLFIKN